MKNVVLILKGQPAAQSFQRDYTFEIAKFRRPTTKEAFFFFTGVDMMVMIRVTGYIIHMIIRYRFLRRRRSKLLENLCPGLMSLRTEKDRG